MRNLLIGTAAMLSLFACGHSETNRDIAHVTIFYSECAHCSEKTYVINNDGTMAFGGTTSFVARDSRAAAAMIKSFPVDQLRWASSNNVRIRQSLTLAFVRVDFRDGTHVDASVPAADSPTYPEIGRLEGWLSLAMHVSRAVAFGPRARAIDEALKKNLLTSVRLEMFGCFGSCPAYTVTFTRQGATIVDSGPGCIRKARASIGINRVAAALREGEASQLLPAYPIQWVDTRGARITLVVNGRTYESEGRDAVTWQRPFDTTVARLDQIVSDAAWTPAIDFTQVQNICGRRST